MTNHTISFIFHRLSSNCRTNIECDGDHTAWVMNAAPDMLEGRMEVQFYDKFDLLGAGDDPTSIAKGEEKPSRTFLSIPPVIPLNPLTTVTPVTPRTPMQSTVFESEEGEETVLKQEYVHNAHIMIGMILRAKPKKIVARRKSFVDSKFLNVHYSIGFCVFECALFCPKKIRYCCYCYFWYFAVITVITNVTVGTVIIVIVFLCYILILFLRFFLTFIF